MLRLELSDWGYLRTAIIELTAARVWLFTAPTQRMLQQIRAPLPAIAPPQKSASARIEMARLSWAIAAAAQRVPWRSDCLVQVIAASRWMRRYHLRPDFYLGVSIPEDGVLAAHAWLRYGDLTVTGGSHSGFAALIEPATKNDVTDAGFPRADQK